MRRKRIIRQKRKTVDKSALARGAAVLQQLVGMDARQLAPSSLPPRRNPCAT